MSQLFKELPRRNVLRMEVLYVGADEESAYFSDGLADTLLAQGPRGSNRHPVNCH